MTLPIARGIMLEACRQTKLAPSLVMSRSRYKRAVTARHAMMYAIKERTAFSYPRIGAFFGAMDHSTIIHGVERAREMMASDPHFLDLVNALMACDPLVMVSVEAWLTHNGEPLLHPDGRFEPVGEYEATSTQINELRAATWPPSKAKVKPPKFTGVTKLKQPRPPRLALPPADSPPSKLELRLMAMREDGARREEIAFVKGVCTGSDRLADALRAARAA